MKGSKWSEQDIRVLTEAVSEGGEGVIPVAAIKLGRSVRATRHQAVALGVIAKCGPCHLTDVVKARVRAAAAAKSITACAVELGHDVRTLKLLAEKEGFAFAPGRAPPKPKAPKVARAPKPVAVAPAPKLRVRKLHAPGSVAKVQAKAAVSRVAKPEVPTAVCPPTAPRVAAAASVRKPVSRDISRLADRFLAWREGVT